MSNQQHKTDRLDHIEQTLDKLTRAHEDAAQHLQATNQTLDRLAELLARSYKQSNERMTEIEQHLADAARNIAFMQAQMRGHTSQPVPPAHPAPDQE
ncbi:MAG: hypothetical protein OXF54_11640 [Caldilineaceae bacterium]|nr:hypothetical protein [Caldilineaceae bacterium]